MRSGVVALSLVALAMLLPKQSKTPVAQELPVDRIADTYAVYEAALHNSRIGDHTGDPKTYFIADRTEQTYSVTDPAECIFVPSGEKEREALEQAIGDFRGQNGNVYHIVNRFNLNGHKVRLLNEAEENSLEAWLAGDKGEAPPFVDASDIIRLSRVGFSSDHSLAIVVISNYCGTLCGSERWRIFKRAKDVWIEQQWNKCVTVS